MFHQSGRLRMGDCTKLQDPDWGRILAVFFCFLNFVFVLLYVVVVFGGRYSGIFNVSVSAADCWVHDGV